MTVGTKTKFLIIGLGVIGGSYAKALTKAGYDVCCITKEQADIDYALERGFIREGWTAVKKEVLENADIIVFSLYPKTFIEWIRTYGDLIRPGTLITDVSGVKSGVIETVQSLLPEGVEFISAHPMAGRERSGVEYSDEHVFLGANYLVVPTDKNTPEAIETCRTLGQILGFERICTVDAAFHDRMIAYLSQLTHIIAVCLMNANTEEHMEKYTGDSFRDLTRIAKINERMWSELFLMNRETLLAQMDGFEKEFRAFRQMLAEEDDAGMKEKMKYASARRTLFDKPERR